MPLLLQAPEVRNGLEATVSEKSEMLKNGRIVVNFYGMRSCGDINDFSKICK